jgi:hypothetical protein
VAVFENRQPGTAACFFLKINKNESLALFVCPN